MFTNDRLKLIDVNSVRMKRNGDKLRLRNMESLQRTEKTRLFNKHNITGINDGFANKIKPLHRTGQRKNIVKLAVQPAVGKNAVEICAAQRQIAFGRTVLKQSVGFISEQLIGNCADLFLREALFRGIAAAERDDVRITQKLEKLPDRAA